MLQSLISASPPSNPILQIQMKMRLRCSCSCRAAAFQSFAKPATGGLLAIARKSKSSLYEVLRVNHNASPVEIKTAYRTLAKLYHPDALDHSQSQSHSDARDFIQIHNAYQTLFDPSSRALYDLSLGLIRETRLTTSSFTSVGRRPTRRWETDQCW